MFDSVFSSAQQNVYQMEVDYLQEEKLKDKLIGAGIAMERLVPISNKKRRIEWMSIRSMLIDLKADSADIIYNEDGKPFFKKCDDHLSISHSNERVAISISKVNSTGVDIQFITEKVLRIRNKFLNEKDVVKVELTPTTLCCYWAIKEALYKVSGRPDIFLKENVFIEAFQFEGNSGSAVGTVKTEEGEIRRSLNLHKIDNYILAYTLNP